MPNPGTPTTPTPIRVLPRSFRRVNRAPICNDWVRDVKNQLKDCCTSIIFNHAKKTFKLKGFSDDAKALLYEVMCEMFVIGILHTAEADNRMSFTFKVIPDLNFADNLAELWKGFVYGGWNGMQKKEPNETCWLLARKEFDAEEDPESFRDDSMLYFM